MAKQQQLPLYSICSLTETATIESKFMIDRLENFLETQKNLYFPHKHLFFQVVLFTKGSGEHIIDFIHFPVEKNQIYFLAPGQVHAWNFRGIIKGFIIHFSIDFLQSFIRDPDYLNKFSLFSGLAIKQVIDVTGSDAYTIQIFEEIMAAASSNIYREDKIKVGLLRLFLQVSGNIQEPVQKKNKKSDSEVLYKFQALINRNYKSHILTRDYAAELSITPNHLNALCRKETGNSAGGLIRERLLLEAKRLLINNKTTILDVSNSLNFIDNSYFTKFFKKYTGITPEKFKNSIKLENAEYASIHSKKE